MAWRENQGEKRRRNFESIKKVKTMYARWILSSARLGSWKCWTEAMSDDDSRVSGVGCQSEERAASLGSAGDVPNIEFLWLECYRERVFHFLWLQLYGLQCKRDQIRCAIRPLSLSINSFTCAPEKRDFLSNDGWLAGAGWLASGKAIEILFHVY